MLMSTSETVVVEHRCHGLDGMDRRHLCGCCLSMKMLILTSKTDMVRRCGTAPIRPISLCERLGPEPYLAGIWIFSATDFTRLDFFLLLLCDPARAIYVVWLQIELRYCFL